MMSLRSLSFSDPICFVYSSSSSNPSSFDMKDRHGTRLFRAWCASDSSAVLALPLRSPPRPGLGSLERCGKEDSPLSAICILPPTPQIHPYTHSYPTSPHSLPKRMMMTETQSTNLHSVQISNLPRKQRLWSCESSPPHKLMLPF